MTKKPKYKTLKELLDGGIPPTAVLILDNDDSFMYADNSDHAELLYRGNGFCQGDLEQCLDILGIPWRYC